MPTSRQSVPPTAQPKTLNLAIPNPISIIVGMGSPESGEQQQPEEAESLEARRRRVADAFRELKVAVEALVESGAAQDAYAHTPELNHARDLGEQLRGEPVRGNLNGGHYFLLGMPPSSLTNPVPPKFTEPLVLGVLEGVIKKQRLQQNSELVIGVSPFVLSEREDIKAHYEQKEQALNRWRQPLGLRNQDLKQQLWLPAVDFKFVLDHPDDDYMAAEVDKSDESSQDA
jgi:hypothetical protein